MAHPVNTRRLDEKRFLDVNAEPNKILPPLPHSSKSEAIPTLLDAIKSSEHLVEYLREKAEEALKKCKSSKDKLTRDQSAALYLYSMQWPKGKDSFFFLFNRALRNEDRTKLVPYHNYFKLFMSALNKLPSKEQQVWRGVVGDLTDRYLTGTTHVWWGASSCTDQVHVTGTFLDQTKKRTLFNIKCYNGKVIKDYSEFANESETILPPGSYLTVVSSLPASSDLYIVELKQVPPDPKLISQTTLTASGMAKKKDSDLYLIWSDPTVNNSSENKEIQEKLRDIFLSNFKSFESGDQCENFINQNQNQRLVVIVSGQIGRDLVPKIHTLSQVISIYVYCMDKKANEKWAKNYDKVKAVVIQSTDLIGEMEKEKTEQQFSQDPLGDFSSQLNLDSESNDILCSAQCPFRGYEKTPLESLPKALQSLNDSIPDLDRLVWMTLQNSSDDNKDGLSKDESAAIRIYTTEHSEHEYSLYLLLNQDLRSEDRHKLKKWFSYLKLFMAALHKIPSRKLTVWRGIRVDLSKDYHKGKRSIWWAVTTTTSDASILENDSFLGKYGARTLFSIECEHGKDIGEYSYFKYEKEILLMPGFSFEVTAVMEPAPDLHVIHLREIDPLF